MKDLPFSRDTVVNDRPCILREGIPDQRHSVTVVWRQMIAYDLTPPPTMSTALVVRTRALIMESWETMDWTVLRALADLIDAKIVFLTCLSTSAE